MKSITETNCAIAKACGLPTERLMDLHIHVRVGCWPLVRALYRPEDAGELIEVLGALEFHEDLAHVVDTPAGQKNDAAA